LFLFSFKFLLLMKNYLRQILFIVGVFVSFFVFGVVAFNTYQQSKIGGVRSVRVQAVIEKALPSHVPSQITPKPSPGVPEAPEIFYTYPSFEFFVSRGAILLLIFLWLVTPLVVLVKLDVSFLAIPALLVFLWRKLLIIFKGKKEPIWGRVYALNVSRSVFFVRVDVYDFSGELLESGHTDLSGRFGFSLPEDRYLLEISKPGYSLVRVEGNVIRLSGGEIVYKYEQGAEVLFFMEKTNYFTLFGELWGEELILEICDFLIILGFLFSIIRLVSYPSVLNSLIFSLYLLHLFLWTSWLR